MNRKRNADIERFRPRNDDGTPQPILASWDAMKLIATGALAATPMVWPDEGAYDADGTWCFHPDHLEGACIPGSDEPNAQDFEALVIDRMAASAFIQVKRKLVPRHAAILVKLVESHRGNFAHAYTNVMSLIEEATAEAIRKAHQARATGVKCESCGTPIEAPRGGNKALCERCR